MIRPNLAMDAPPTVISVGGAVYRLNTDYRIWIEISALLRQMYSSAETDAEINHNALVLSQISALALSDPIAWDGAEQITDFIRGIAEFIAGYPQPPMEAERRRGAQTVSFEQDINAIILAIRCQFGVDLSAGHECHWWLFLEYFRNLSGDHHILRLMEIRGYDGKDTELRRRAAKFALPPERSIEEQQARDAMNALFEQND